MASLHTKANTVTFFNLATDDKASLVEDRLSDSPWPLIIVRVTAGRVELEVRMYRPTQCSELSNGEDFELQSKRSPVGDIEYTKKKIKVLETSFESQQCTVF